MIRGSLTLWLLVATIAGIGLFLVKGEVQLREDRLHALHREILENQEAIRVLKAEWSYLNRPDRIEMLARKHLDLVPLDRNHMRRLEELPHPQPVAGPGPVAPSEVPALARATSTATQIGERR